MPAPVVAPVAPAPVVTAKPVVPANGAVKPVVPVPEGAAKPEGVPAPVEAKIKLKVDGQVEEMTQAELEKWANKGRYSDKVTQEGREAIKRANAAVQELQAREAAAKERAKNDTDAWMKEHGIDPDEFAQKRLQKKVDEGKLTQAEREALELKAENQRLKDEFDKKEKEREAETQKQMTAQLQRRIQNELVNATKRAGMSIGDESFYAIYESFREAFELGLLPTDEVGLQPHHADRIIEDAQEKLNGAQKNLRENALKLKGPALLAFVGKEAVDNIVAARLDEIRAARGIATPAPAEQPKPAAPRPNGYLSPAEAEAQLKALQRRP